MDNESYSVFQRSTRPICELWRQGRCTFSSIQCQFRHEDDSYHEPVPVLDRAFVVVEPQDQLLLPADRRRPLQEIPVPRPSPMFQMGSGGPGLFDHGMMGGPFVRSGHMSPEALGYTRSADDNHPGADGGLRVNEDFESDSGSEFDDGFEVDGALRAGYGRRADDDDAVFSDTSSENYDSDKENEAPEVMDVEVLPSTEVDISRQDATRESFSPRLSPTIFVDNTGDLTMANSQDENAPPANGIGPHPSFIQVANPYIFEQKLQNSLSVLGATEHKEDAIRLQGVHYIDSVRKALQLPLRTFNTAVVYYHKFRLVHADNEYIWMDAAAAALFTACKIEDTLKKSREVLCAAYNLKVPSSEHASPDDPIFEQSSKTVVGLERLMLESAGFDFRNRHPQEIVLKLVRDSGLSKETLGRIAFNMCIDIYRTFAPLKQTAQTMAIACVELTARLLNLTMGFDLDLIVGSQGINLEKWSTTRAEIMETLLDLLDLFTHHRNATIVGGQFSIDNFITARISLNKEATTLNLPRYAEWIDAPKSVLNGAANGSKPSPMSPAVPSSNQSPDSPPAMGPTSVTGAKSRVGERGKDGTVRFMLSADRARAEKDAVAKYFASDEWEEYEEEIDVPMK